MKLYNAFDLETTQHFLERIEKLNPDSQPKWGKMNVGQMLAHVNVAYDLDNGTIPSKPSPIAKFFLKAFVKKIVVGDKPYKKNSRTAPAFLITDEKVFEIEKGKLIEHIKTTQEKGASHYDKRENPSFGVLSAKEWSTMFTKHLDHHLLQFEV